MSIAAATATAAPTVTRAVEDGFDWGSAGAGAGAAIALVLIAVAIYQSKARRST
jgi:hypothetical protein